ncbi:MAG: hypothetical protein JWP63_6504 [Candidatus Solibacter sp.]|jgi:hypothetical protein|nr:hypothetical protein [Candidatus Solibacter sp.]
MRLFLAALILPALSWGAIWPDTIGAFHRAGTSNVKIDDRALWDEYGLKESEGARYENGDESFTVTGYRLQDTTGALAAFYWQRPPAAKPSKAAPLSVETPDALVVVHGNYLLEFSGRKPEPAELSAVFDGMKQVDTTALPALTTYLPSTDLVPNSERYIVGPNSLAKFDGGIAPSVAAFHYGAEAQLGVFHSPKGDITMAIFNYPTPQIAMQKEADFRNIPGGPVVKRTGPLVAVVLAPPDPDTAERLLAQVKYRASVTLDQYVPTQRDNIGNLVVNAFVLIGILLAFALVSGLAVGGWRAFRHRGNRGDEADALVSLNIQR